MIAWLAAFVLFLEKAIPFASKLVDFLIQLREDSIERNAIKRKADADAKFDRDQRDIDNDFRS